MTLDPDEKELLESLDRGEWLAVDAGEVARMREFARNQLRAGERADFGALAPCVGRRLSAESTRLADRIKARGRTKVR